MKKTLFIDLVVIAIEGMPNGTIVRLHVLYEHFRNFLLTGNSPNAPEYVKVIWAAAKQCAGRGDLANEPRYKNDIRFAILRARKRGLLKHIGNSKSGEYLRV